jgi:hypothetical protein
LIVSGLLSITEGPDFYSSTYLIYARFSLGTEINAVDGLIFVWTIGIFDI